MDRSSFDGLPRLNASQPRNDSLKKPRVIASSAVFAGRGIAWIVRLGFPASLLLSLRTLRFLQGVAIQAELRGLPRLNASQPRNDSLKKPRVIASSAVFAGRGIAWIVRLGFPASLLLSLRTLRFLQGVAIQAELRGLPRLNASQPRNDSLKKNPRHCFLQGVIIEVTGC